MSIVLVLGGTRSGKSAHAENLAHESGLPVTYIATAMAANSDEEMARRIELHQKRRPPHWQTIEEPIHLARTLTRLAAPGQCLLIESIDMWLSNLLLAGDEKMLAAERKALLDILPALAGMVIMVSAESGLGPVPSHPLARRFVDLAGETNQQLAALCHKVTLVAAGLPLALK